VATTGKSETDLSLFSGGLDVSATFSSRRVSTISTRSAFRLETLLNDELVPSCWLVVGGGFFASAVPLFWLIVAPQDRL
jgi:hypothetical protein